MQNLSLGRNNFIHPYRLGSQLAGKQVFRKYPGGPGGQVELTSVMCPHCKEAKSLLGCIRKNIASRSREATLPFLLALVGHVAFLCSSGLSSKREKQTYWSKSNKGTWRYLHHWSVSLIWGNAEGDGTVQRETEKFQEVPINVCKYPMNGIEDQHRFFSVVFSDRTRDNGLRLKHRKFHKNVFGFFTADQTPELVTQEVCEVSAIGDT